MALAIAVATIGLLIYVPRKHIAAVLPSGAMDLIPGGDEIPFEPPGSMEIDGILSSPNELTDVSGFWIDNILPRWKPDEELLFFSHVPRTST